MSIIIILYLAEFETGKDDLENEVDDQNYDLVHRMDPAAKNMVEKVGLYVVVVEVAVLAGYLVAVVERNYSTANVDRCIFPLEETVAVEDRVN